MFVFILSVASSQESKLGSADMASCQAQKLVRAQGKTLLKYMKLPLKFEWEERGSRAGVSFRTAIKNSERQKSAVVPVFFGVLRWESLMIYEPVCRSASPVSLSPRPAENLSS